MRVLRGLFSLETLAPELRASRRDRVLLGLTALFVFGLALVGTGLAFYLKDSRASVSVSQVEYFSIEVFGTAPAARLIYFPEKKTAVVRAWLIAPLRGAGVYQVWAEDGLGGFRSLGHGDPIPVWGLTVVAEGIDLRGIATFIITVEPPGGSPSAPTTEPIARLRLFKARLRNAPRTTSRPSFESVFQVHGPQPRGQPSKPGPDGWRTASASSPSSLARPQARIRIRAPRLPIAGSSLYAYARDRA